MLYSSHNTPHYGLCDLEEASIEDTAGLFRNVSFLFEDVLALHNAHSAVDASPYGKIQLDLPSI